MQRTPSIPGDSDGCGTLRAGLYAHVPFCLAKCPYCDFYSVTELELKKAYLSALSLEMDRISEDGPSLYFDSLYLGGGTPSLLDPDEVARIIRWVRDRFRLSPDAEITLETNPGTVDVARLMGYRDAGINRIQIGVQSFRPENLAFLGRIHSAAQGASAVEGAIRAGFENIGIDLIYGLPGQIRQGWLTDLEAAVAFNPAHLSCYLLSYEPGTLLHARRQAGEIRTLPLKRRAGLFMSTVRFLEARGYAHYEISNFAKILPDGKTPRSRHNQKYWTFLPYVGLGPGAHSFAENERTWNVRNLRQYIEVTQSGRRPLDGTERLSHRQQMVETLFLGLRRREGISPALFEARFGGFFSGPVLKMAEGLEERGWLLFSPKRFALTREGMPYLDSIVEAFIDFLPGGDATAENSGM